MIKGVPAAWTFAFALKAQQQFNQLDKATKVRIQKKIESLITGNVHPKTVMKPLTGTLQGLYSLRIGTYRLICTINAGEWVIVALHIGHRRDVYTRL